MSTWNGVHDNLVFKCGSCNHHSIIEIDLAKPEDKDRLWSWLWQHSADGGIYVNKEIDLENIHVKNRTDSQHQALIKKYGGVREYLLSMGEFKEDKMIG